MRFIVPLTLGVLLAAGVAAAAEKCPLDLGTCLGNYQHLRERPWLGVDLGHDGEGRLLVTAVVPRSPGQRAGVRVGDVIERIEGLVPDAWFAATDAWKPGDVAGFAVVRREELVVLKLRYEAMPETEFERILGAHVAEAHLGYARDEKTASTER